ncbi:MAG: hypothetical protein MUE40_02725 [Anaerolineae bacterium]|nr:hypothetical protein [Anaerolineae bacterium]
MTVTVTMTVTTRKSRAGAGLSRLDVTVLLVAALLLVGTAAVTYLGSPQLKGTRVAYLYPAYGGIQNIWLTSYDHPADAIQVTDTPGGVYNFSVSQDGRYLAYAARDVASSLNELFLLDLRTRQVQQLTNCVAEGADCRTPQFRPDGNVIAYERANVNNAGDPNLRLGPGAIRIWLLDISRQPYTTRPLTDNSQFIGHSPQWSQDGQTIAFFNADVTNPGIMVYNFAPTAEERSLKFIPANNGVVGSLSPNGEQLVFPDIEQRGDGIATLLKIADLTALEFVPLTPADVTAEDSGAIWHPDGQRLAIERRYNDERYTRGFQIYLLTRATGALEPLSVDERYSHGYFEWNAPGDKLLFQRFALVDVDGVPAGEARPEIWVRDMLTGDLRELAENAFHPRFVLP